MSYTRANKTCQGHSLYCAVIAVKENLFSCIHDQLKLVKENCYQGTCQGKLGRLCGCRLPEIANRICLSTVQNQNEQRQTMANPRSWL